MTTTANINKVSTKTKLIANLLLFSLMIMNIASIKVVAQNRSVSTTGTQAKTGILIADRPSGNGGGKLTYNKVAGDLREKMSDAYSTGGTVKVIIQRNAKASNVFGAFLRQNGVRMKGNFDKINATAIEMPAEMVDQMSALDEVDSIVVDAPINSLGHVNTTTGVELVRSQTSGGPNYILDGTGIGIAVIDSGMYSGHKAFAKKNGLSGGRIVYNQDFTGENRTDDPFGHGTHVATAAAGLAVSGTAGNRFEGVANNANLINLRVLNSRGTGTTSGLLNALNWVLTNKATYNIRVVNMSLGTPAVNSYTVDPICLAVRSLVNAGVVVVAASGNDGKNVSGDKQYGTIHSPGNEPSAITVGASNTFGTDVRSDDTVTTYSSRGPTRSYKTDIYGIKHYDNQIKPDLVAPGNKLIYAESPANLVVVTYPSLEASTGQNAYRYMYMSGSSMATPITAGAAALLLQANPKLTPNMVKMILTYTAQQLPGYNTFEQGAGEINIEGAVRLAKLVSQNLTSTTPLGAAMLTGGAPTPQSTVGGTTFPWAQGIIMDKTYATGSDLITKYQRIYDLGVLIGDGTSVNANGVLVSDTTNLMNTVTLGQNIKTSTGVLIGDGTDFMNVGLIVFGDGVQLSDGALLRDGVLLSDSVLVRNGVLIGDTTDAQGVLVNGDQTECMY